MIHWAKPGSSLGLGVLAIAVFVAGFIALILVIGAVTAIFGVITLGELARRFVVLGGLITGAVGFSFGLLWRYVTTLVGLGAIWLWAQAALQRDKPQPAPVGAPVEG